MGERKSESVYSVEQALAVRSISGNCHIGLSPDGKWVAYTIKEANPDHSLQDQLYMEFSPTGVSTDVGQSALSVTEIATGETTCLTPDGVCSWSPCWSPDGQSLAYYSAEGGAVQLWVWNHNTREKRCLSPRIVRAFFAIERPCWNPTGTVILTKVLPEGVTIDEANAWSIRTPKKGELVDKKKGTTVTVFDGTDPSIDNLSAAFNRYQGDLVLVDVNSSTVTTVASAVKVIGYDLSPSGRSVSYYQVTSNTRNSENHVCSSLTVVSLSDFKATVLKENISDGYMFPTMNWSPDEQHIAFTSCEPNIDERCQIVEVATGDLRMVSSPGETFFKHDYRGPLWSADGRSFVVSSGNEIVRVDVEATEAKVVATLPCPRIYDIVATHDDRTFWSPDDGRSIAVIASDPETLIHQLWRVNLDSGESLCFDEIQGDLGSSALFSMDMSQEGNLLAYKSQNIKSPGDLWICDFSSNKTQQITHVNSFLETLSLGFSRIVEWQNDYGNQLKGGLLLPADYEEGMRYPVIVSVYPTQQSDRAGRYAIEGNPGGSFTDLHLLASRGYAVFVPDVLAGGHQNMFHIADCVMSGLNKIIDLGIADPDRLGVIGQSSGGNAVLSLIVQTNRFKAAVACASFGDWVMLASSSADGSTFGMSYSESQLDASIWKDRHVYIENSPFYFLDRVKTPLLLIHGGIDTSTPHWQAEQTYAAMKHLKKTVCLARYEGEDHWHGTWSHANRVDFSNRVLDWFEKYLG